VGTRWQKLAGDTEHFAIKLSFADDPDPQSVSSREEAVSWGALELWVNGHNLCAGTYADEQFDAVHWYLLPLFEWFIDKWDPLFHEERLPGPGVGSAQDTLRASSMLSSRGGRIIDSWEWWGRHSLEAPREGGIFPAVYFRRWRDLIEVSWADHQSPARPAGLRFGATEGSATFRPQDVVSHIHSVIGDATEYLLSRVPPSERLQRLRQRVASRLQGGPERYAWLAGLGSSLEEMLSAWQRIRCQLEAKSGAAINVLLSPAEGLGGLVTSPPPAALMFGAVSPTLVDSDRLALLDAMVNSIGTVCDRLEPLVSVATTALNASESLRPWERGQEVALAVLERLGIEMDAVGPVDIYGIANEWSIRCGTVRLEDDSIRGVSIAGNRLVPTILTNPKHGTSGYVGGRRFTVAHELGHLLMDRSMARDVAVPSGPWAPRDIERRANAFAAMFLMPPSKIDAAIRAASITRFDIMAMRVLSRTLETSPVATCEHLCNLGFISESERDTVLARLGGAARIR
jgi:hypothetical protein